MNDAPALAFIALLAVWCLVLLFFYAFPDIDPSAAHAFFSVGNCRPQAGAEAVCAAFALPDRPLLDLLRDLGIFLSCVAGLILIAIPLGAFRRSRADWRTPINELCLLALMSLALDCSLRLNAWLKTFAGRSHDANIYASGLDFLKANSFAGKCAANCSFISGEASAGGWLFCLVVLLPGHLRRPLGLPLAAVSLLVPALRVVTSVHYLSDTILGFLSSLVIFSGVLALAPMLGLAQAAAPQLAVTNAGEIVSQIRTWLARTGARLATRSRRRLRNACRRFFASEERVTPERRAVLERPVIVLSIFLALALLTMLTVDYPLGLWMQSVPKALDGTVKFLSDLGTGQLLLTTSGLLLLVRLLAPFGRLRRGVVSWMNAASAATAFVFLAVAGGGLASALVKNAIGRARPELLAVDGPFYFRPFAFNPEFAAFPSGHSATAGAMAMSIALVFPALRPFVFCLGALICLSRQMIGAHWASDTVMGWAIGAAFTLWLAHMFARRQLVFRYGSEGRLVPLSWQRPAGA